MMELKITQLSQNSGQIAGLPANPRQWKKADVERLAKSIEETPELLDARPLIVMPHDGKYIVLGGNLRLAALKHLGRKAAPVYVLPDDTPIDKQKEIVIKDNGSFGEWDYDVLANEWDDLPLADWGVPSWETETEEMANVTEEMANVTEDDFDEEQDEIHVRCQKGDIWQLGDHRLMCCDSTDLETVKRLMGGALADLLLTDPPYNVDYGDETQKVMEKRKHRTDGLIVLNDNMKSEDFLRFLITSFACAEANMKAGAAFYIFHSDTEGFNFRKALYVTKGMHLSACLIWVKDSLCLGRSDYQWRHEPCLYGWKEGAAHHWYNDRKQTTCLEFAKPKKSEEHPTMKPIPLFSYLMENSTKKGDVVLDPFAGSGTTLICAEQLGRRCFTIELDPHYCDVIIARWEKFTGKEAVKL